MGSPNHHRNHVTATTTTTSSNIKRLKTILISFGCFLCIGILTLDNLKRMLIIDYYDIWNDNLSSLLLKQQKDNDHYSYFDSSCIDPLLLSSSLKDDRTKQPFLKPPDTYTCSITRHDNETYEEPLYAPILPTIRSSAITTTRHDTFNLTRMTLPKIPDFIIAGAQKGGTTALQSILRFHPQLLPAHGLKKLINTTKPEPHFFDFRGGIRYPIGNSPKQLKVLQNLQHDENFMCEVRTNYATTFFYFDELMHHLPLKSTNHTRKFFSYEKTPDYMYYPVVPQLIYRVCPWTKIVLMLRNPIDRYFSAWKMHNHSSARVKNHPYHQKSFEQSVHYDVNILRKNLLTEAPMKPPYWKPAPDHGAFPPTVDFAKLQEIRRTAPDVALKAGLHLGMYAPMLHDWMEYFPLGDKLLVLQYEEFAKNRRAVMNQIHEFVGLPYYNYTDEQLEQDHSPYMLKRKRLKFDDMKPSTRDYLQKFYKPYNEELIQLLKQNNNNGGGGDDSWSLEEWN